MKSLRYIMIITFCLAFSLPAQQKVMIDQAGINNEIIIEQLGQNNQADVIQKVNNSTSDVEQVGNNNTAYQLNSAKRGDYVNDQLVDQKGNNNQAVQIGLNGSGYGIQVIRQDGQGNYATQLRRGDASSAFITQIGQQNRAEENILGAGDNAIARILQEGNANFSRINIEGSQALVPGNAKTKIETHGNNNGRILNPIKINMVGDNHTAKILQGLNGDINNNLASINLVGGFTNSETGSNATINQEYGHNNTAKINIVGQRNGLETENGIEIIQHGSNNSGELNVFGAGLGGSIIQLGNNATVKVTRTN